MNTSESSYTSGAERENVVQAFKDWRAKDPLISDGITRRNFPTRPSIMRRVLRTIGFGVVAVFIALGFVIWQSGSGEVAKAISTLQASLTRLTAQPAASPIGAGNAPAQNTAASQDTPPASTSQPTEEQYNSLKHQLDAVASELTDVHRIAEQLAANQKRLGDDLGAIKASQESMKQKLLPASAHSGTPPASAKKKPQVPSRLGVMGPSPNEHLSPGAPLPLH
jgi:hypothetical protein